MKSVFIPGNTPSSKNSRKLFIRNGKPGSTMSRASKNYLRGLGIQKMKKQEMVGYKTRPNLFLDIISEMRFDLSCAHPPYLIGYWFVRKNRSKFDLHNMIQIVADMLVAARVIPDDDANNLVLFPVTRCGETFEINKEHPGVWLFYDICLENFSKKIEELF